MHTLHVRRIFTVASGCTLEDGARGLRLRVYSRYFSRVQEFSEREKKRKRARGKGGEIEKVSATTCDNCTSLLTFRALHRELDMIYELWAAVSSAFTSPSPASKLVWHPPFWDEHPYTNVGPRRSARSDAGPAFRSAHSSVMCLDTI